MSGRTTPTPAFNLGFPTRVVRGEGLHIGVQMIAQRLGRSITDAAIEQLFDESLIDELERSVKSIDAGANLFIL
jgi:hypothetical protein